MQCLPSFALTEGNLNCTIVVQNCQIYSNINGSCIQCLLPYNLTASSLCACPANTILTVGNLACANSIVGCLNYSDDQSCQSCNSSLSPTSDKKLCVKNITNCVDYINIETCKKCQNPTVLSFGNTTCVPPIPNCINYSANGSCLDCGSSKQLTYDLTSCVDPIVNCLAITNQSLCIQCIIEKIPSFNKTACVFSIPSCQKQTDDQKCLSCLFGFNVTQYKNACIPIVVPASEANKTIQAQIATATDSNLTTNSTLFLSKTQNTTIDLVNNVNPNYTIGLDKPYIVFTNDSNPQSQIKVAATAKPTRKTTTTSISVGLSNLPSGNYAVKCDVSFSKSTSTSKNMRILEVSGEDLPDYFTVEYFPKMKFYVGSEQEIQSEYQKVVAQEKAQEEIESTTKNTQTENLTWREILIIILSIFGSVLMAGLIIKCIMGKRTKNKYGKPNFETSSNNVYDNNETHVVMSPNKL